MTEAVQRGGVQVAVSSLLFSLVLSNFQNVLYHVRHGRIFLKYEYLGMSRDIAGC